MSRRYKVIGWIRKGEALAQAQHEMRVRQDREVRNREGRSAHMTRVNARLTKIERSDSGRKAVLTRWMKRSVTPSNANDRLRHASVPTGE